MVQLRKVGEKRNATLCRIKITHVEVVEGSGLVGSKTGKGNGRTGKRALTFGSFFRRQEEDVALVLNASSESFLKNKGSLSC